MKLRKDNRLRKGMVRSTIRMLIPLDKQNEALDILGFPGNKAIYDQLTPGPEGGAAFLRQID